MLTIKNNYSLITSIFFFENNIEIVDIRASILKAVRTPRYASMMDLYIAMHLEN